MGKRRQPAWRAWVVRGLVFGSTGMVLAVASVFWAWTNPAQLRQTVLTTLMERVPGIGATLEGASMRLLGGITLLGLRVSRSDDLDKSDFFYVPRAVLYHDKEQLIDGKLAIRKVELQEPRLRLVRGRTGMWNLENLMPVTGGGTDPIPTLVVEGGVLQIEDRSSLSGVGGSPLGHLLEIRQVEMLAMNDPPGMFRLEAKGVSDLLGPVTLTLEQERSGKMWAARVELTELPLDTGILRAAAGLLKIPELATLDLSGAGQVVLDLSGGGDRPISHQASFQFKNLQARASQLPLQLKDGSIEGRLTDGQVPLLMVQGKIGDGQLKARLDNLSLKPVGGAVTPESLGGTWRAALTGLTVTPELLKSLPHPAPSLHELLNPAGVMDITYARDPAPSQTPGQNPNARHRVEVRPRFGTLRPKHFPYPLTDLTGMVAVDLMQGLRPSLDVDLQGLAGADPWTAKGPMVAEKGAWGIDLHVQSAGVAIDQTLIGALPAEYRNLAAQFNPQGGRVKIDYRILADVGVPGLRNVASLGISEAVVRYEHFPILLEKVRGTLDILPDHWVCRDFVGERDGGEIRLAGRSWPAPKPAVDSPAPGVKAPEVRPESVAKAPAPEASGGPKTGEAVAKQGPAGGFFRLVLRGEKLPVDDEFRSALAPPGAPERNLLLEASKFLGLTDRLSFDADVVQKRMPSTELDVEVALRQATMQPRQFPIKLEDIQAVCRYSQDRILIRDLRMRHGASQLALKDGTVQLRQGGGYRCRFEGVRAEPLVLEDSMLAAMPAGTRRALQALELKDQVRLMGNITVESGNDARGAWPQVDWDGTLKLKGARLMAGVEAKDLVGEVVCSGKFNGTTVDHAQGNMALEQGAVFGQPIGPMRARFEMRPDSPDVLRLKDIQGDLYGGVVGGQGRVQLAARPRFELDLRASQVDLAQAARRNGLVGDLEGLAYAWLHLSGEAGDPGSFKGEGRLDIPRGRLYELPVFLDLMKAGGLRAPDRTAFEEARAEVAFEGHQVRVKRLDLLGNAFSLRGKGTVHMETQETNLDFHVDLARLNQVLPAGINEITKLVSDQLLAIEVRGKPGQLRFEKQFLPPVSSPIRKLVGPTGE